MISLVVGGHGRETEQSEASREGADGDRGGHPQSTRNGNPSELSCVIRIICLGPCNEFIWSCLYLMQVCTRAVKKCHIFKQCCGSGMFIPGPGS